MSFFNSIKNQVGRDIGKSISNVILKDAHATPIRMAGKSQSNQATGKNRKSEIAEYERKIKLIDLGQTPKTIIRKLGVVLIEFESDIKSYLMDGFIDLKEEIEIAKRFYKILDVFSKIEKQFSISGEDTQRLFKIYRQHFKGPMLLCINQLLLQEKEELLISKYTLLYNEIEAIG